MNIETVAIDTLLADPSNVRRHPQRNLETIMASLTKFGQQKPIIVDAQNIVIAGNGTLQAAKQLGWAELQIVRTQLTGSAATAFAIADNRTAELAEWDSQGLADTLAALRAEDEDLAGAAGFSADEIAKLFGAEPEPEADEPPADFPEVDENIHTDFACPKCGYAWSGKAAG